MFLNSGYIIHTKLVIVKYQIAILVNNFQREG
nr:MAG TPA: hypothetical protein [Caudoviricetes sp.]